MYRGLYSKAKVLNMEPKPQPSSSQRALHAFWKDCSDSDRDLRELGHQKFLPCTASEVGKVTNLQMVSRAHRYHHSALVRAMQLM